MTPPPQPTRPALLRRSTWTETQFVTDALRTETTGGALLLLAAVAALIFANSPWRDAYASLRDTYVGAGVGSTCSSPSGTGRPTVCSPSSSSSPGSSSSASSSSATCAPGPRPRSRSSAAVGGVVFPALVFLATVRPRSAADGDAMPRLGDPHRHRHRLRARRARRHRLAPAVRPALLPADPRGRRRPHRDHDHRGLLHRPTSRSCRCWPPSCRSGSSRRSSSAGSPTGGSCCRWRSRRGPSCTRSGVHATVAGVLLGLVVPVKPRASVPVDQHPRPQDRRRPPLRAPRCGRSRPASRCRSSPSSPRASPSSAAASRPRLGDPVAIGVVAGLVLGKLVGVFGATWLVARFTRARLDDGLAWRDVAGLSLLTGVGFTVSLLVGELAFGTGSERDDHVKLAVLARLAPRRVLAAVVLRMRNRVYRRIAELESRDDDADGIPDVFERDDHRRLTRSPLGKVGVRGPAQGPQRTSEAETHGNRTIGHGAHHRAAGGRRDARPRGHRPRRDRAGQGRGHLRRQGARQGRRPARRSRLPRASWGSCSSSTAPPGASPSGSRCGPATSSWRSSC